ncbi:MAG: shikimate dehydrogenase [Methanoculleaceae archaeon]
MKVVLTGFRGTGKSEVGRILGDYYNLPLYDTDRLVEEEANATIPGIFEKEGEAGFRRREAAVIARLRDVDGIISCGGGAVINPENVVHLRADATVFLLTADAETIESRIAGTPRPPLTSLPPAEEIRHLLSARDAAYRAAADFCIDTTDLTTEEAAEKIRIILRDGCSDISARAEALPLIGEMPLPSGDLDRIKSMLDGGEGGRTRLCAIIGNPCLHSMSPLVHNALFRRFHLPFYYTAFQSPDAGMLIDLMRRFDIRGYSVTIPHKQAVIPFLDELSPDAEGIGAVNTVIQCGGRCRGENTDWIGIREPVAHLRGGRALIIGAGGAAAAAAYALCDLEMDVSIMNRTSRRAIELAGRFGCKACPWGAIKGDFDLLINATPVGMGGNGIPVSLDHLSPDTTVFDLVYTPPCTPLINAARQRGCETVTGTELFIYQAAAQFRLFTGIEVGPETIRELI